MRVNRYDLSVVNSELSILKIIYFISMACCKFFDQMITNQRRA